MANLSAATFLAFAFSLVFPLFLTVRVEAQCSDDYLKSIPPPVAAIGAVRVVQLVNCTNQVLLGATNAARQPGNIGFPVFPEEKTWVMQPFDPNNWSNHSNILTINIPKEWANTVCPQNAPGCVATGPVIWARTGCRYDITTNRAQCETGSCADQYDCSTTAHGNPPYITFTEWTFYQKTQSPFIFFDNFDVSAVNGSSLTVDVQPLGGDAHNPFLKNDWLWLAYNAELGMHGAADLRQACGNGKSVSQGGFLLTRLDIDTAGAPNFGFEIVDGNGNLACPKSDPNCDKGNNALGCLNNCGLYKFPHERGTIGCDQDDDNCLGWEVFCAGDPNLYPASSFVCHSDGDCKTYAQQHGGKYGAFASCFINTPGSTSGYCAQRAFYAKDISNCDTLQTNGSYWGAPTKDVPCSFTYKSWNNLTQMLEWGTQPPYGMCSDVKGSGNPIACIGDDTIHKVLHGVYTWPNDPEVFTSDAPAYRVIYAPGYDPTTSAPITPADTIPLCSDLPDNYNYSQNQINCSSQIKEGLIFTVANNLGQNWPCGIAQSSANDQGVLCRFRPAPPGNGNCFPPIVDSDVTHSACGKIDTGTSLVSTVPDNPSGFTPSAGDWLFVGVAIPQVLNNVAPLGNSPLSGCSVNNWTAVPGGSLMINTNQGLLAWYYGQVTASQPNGCLVTAMLPAGNKNPAELKVYDVPQFNQTFDQHSTNTGNFSNVGNPIVGAGQVTTTHAPDLMLGNLLQVNLQPSPATTWNPFLSNNPQQGQLQCLGSPAICPTDDAPDWLPGHGPSSANSDTGHQKLTATGTYAFKRPAQASGQVNWGGVVFSIGLNK